MLHNSQLNIIDLAICAQLSITFWAAAFPGLARNSLEVQESEHLVSTGQRRCVDFFNVSIGTGGSSTFHSSDEHAAVYSMARNKILNTSFAISSAAEVCILAVMVGILRGMHVQDSVENNTKGYGVLLA